MDKLDEKAVHAAATELLRVTDAVGYVALVARTDGKMAFMEFGNGPITERQRQAIDGFKALLAAVMDQGEVLCERTDEDNGMTIQ